MWDFGDGSTSDQRNPTHTYATAGEYDVSLTVTASSGSDKETKPEFITAERTVVAVSGRVVDDEDRVGIFGLMVSIGDASTESRPDGAFSLTGVEVGQGQLVVTEGVTTVLDATVTVGPDGRLAGRSDNVIVIERPDDSIPLKRPFEAPPAVSVEPMLPASREPVTVSFRHDGATAIEFSAEGNGCGDLRGEEVDGETFEQTANVGLAGECRLLLEIATPEGRLRASRVVPVDATAVPVPDVTVLNSHFLPGFERPAPSHEVSAPRIVEVSGPGAIINGGVATFEARLENELSSDGVAQLLVEFDDVNGVFVGPANVQGDKVVFQIALAPGFFNTASSFAFVRGVIQIVDAVGRASDFGRLNVATEEVAQGGLKVSLSWDTPTDVDLHLVEPAPDHEEIYYGNKQSSSGGELDLDSNPDCRIDGVNNENITYPRGSSPPEGEYTVRVDYYSNCGGESAAYTVTVDNCGVRSLFEGTFAPDDEDRGGAGSGREVARFDHDGCSGFRAAGTATYEDRQPTSTGLATTPTTKPIRLAAVEIRRGTDDELLAQGATDANGRFDIRFDNNGDAGYRVLVLAERDDDALRQRVVDKDGNVYVEESEVVDGGAEPRKADIEVSAPMTGDGPAFNIFDMGVLGTAKVRMVTGETPPMLTWQWTRGEQGACRNATSCYRRFNNRISVLSIPADPDEYDDFVLLHEYGHFYQNNFSRSDSPGGSHSSGERLDPRLAWGEGSATFFGNHVAGSSVYIDTTERGTGVYYDIETLDKRIPFGTSDGSQSGLVSEAVVAAVLWDLADEASDTRLYRDGDDIVVVAQDSTHNPSGVFRALGSLHADYWTARSLVPLFFDRGFRGVDLVDFLDQWGCRVGDGMSPNTDISQATLIVEFPYVRPTDSSC